MSDSFVRFVPCSGHLPTLFGLRGFVSLNRVWFSFRILTLRVMVFNITGALEESVLLDRKRFQRMRLFAMTNLHTAVCGSKNFYSKTSNSMMLF